ncbi:C-type lectin [Teratosphaeria destructans]|uniref:C-type lectin n=1 Tax=Teratosphaeria destructans TaxID=418781 RepID=A0A9W7T2F6_9PEZI|nr:C-type lectin [Teratosphaeria destructans]
MPLHLLGKKSWNVYNTANVERVRRDEAEARAREAAEEQRMQDEDAARRIAILRGELPPALAESQSATTRQQNIDDRPPSRAQRSRGADASGLQRKRRKLRGEDDTDRDIRFAREDAETGERARQSLLKKCEENAPLVDHAGHLQLIPAPDGKTIRNAEKNAEAEAEKAKKRKREEDQVTMRFSNAAGFNNSMADPWYASNKRADCDEDASKAAAQSHLQEKDVWGNEDPRRRERERNRISSSDPFAAMQQAQRQLKQSERDRERWQKERAVELEELKRSQEKARRDKRHRRRSDDEDSLEDFSLVAPGAHLGAFQEINLGPNAAYQILYKSTDALGKPTASVTTVIIPNNPDYTKVTGTNTTYGGTGSIEIMLIAAALDQGWVVNTPDWEGINFTFIAGIVAGQSTLDSVRAVLASNSITGVQPYAKVALWGYSGGSLASDFASELQPNYAPELSLSVVGAALGGTTPNITSVLLVPSTAAIFFIIRNQGFYGDVEQYAYQDMFTYFTDGQGILAEPASVYVVNNAGYLRWPTFIYEAVNDVSPIADTDKLVSEYCAEGAHIAYVRNSFGEHFIQAATGAGEVLQFLKSRSATGCLTDSLVRGAEISDNFDAFFTHELTLPTMLSVDGSPRLYTTLLIIGETDKNGSHSRPLAYDLRSSRLILPDKAGAPGIVLDFVAFELLL